MQQKTKRLVARIVLALVVIGLGLLVRDRVAATHAAGWIAAGWALSALVVLRLALALRKGLLRVREHSAGGVDLASLDAATTAAMPSWIRGFYAMEKRAYRYTWRSLTGAPVQAAGPFAVAGGPQGGKRTASLLMSATLCAAAIGYSLPHYLSSLWPQVAAYAGLTVAYLYALVWIVGERRSLKEAGHDIAGDTLLLDIGVRGSAILPLASVSSCVAIGGRTRHDHVWRLTPGEKANVSLEVAQAFEAVVRGDRCQIPAGRVVLYVDDAATFVAAVTRAIVATRLAA
jgi:hypothetical protein